MKLRRTRPEGATLARSVGRRLKEEWLSGLINATASVPDGMAAAALIGVNPVYGLYTSIVAPIAGGLLASSQLMYISATSASAVIAAQAIADVPADERVESLFLFVVMAGLLLVAFGLLRFGRLLRFVSHAVMTGFLTGVAVVLVLGQLPELVGATAEGDNKIEETLDLFRHGASFDPRTMITGALALFVGFGLARTRVAAFSQLAALVFPTLLVVLAGWGNVRRVDDVSAIPHGLPTPNLPDLTVFSPELLVSAIAVAAVIAIYGAGVSEVTSNPDRRPIDPSRDMIAEGAASIASGLFSGIPAGGSVSQTALNLQVGAKSRWASVLGGLWMIVIVLVIPGLVEVVPMSVLSALMILAGIRAIDVEELRSSWFASHTARWPILVTFLATLLLSVPLAFVSGVLITIVIFVSSSAEEVHVRQLTPLGGGRFAEGRAPAHLESGSITVLDAYGSLFFAGARTFAEKLPSPVGAKNPVVILRLRGRDKVGATLADVLDRYADDLADVGGRLYLTGVNPDVVDHLVRAQKLDLGGTVHIMPATTIIGESTEQAMANAHSWLAKIAANPAGTSGIVDDDPA
jgi:SulP family sulfate permease